MNKKLIFFVIPILSVGMYFFSGCKGTSDSNTETLQEVSFENINSVIIEATKNQNPNDIRVGQTFKYEVNYQIELNEPLISSFYEGEVLDIEDRDDHFLITVLETDTVFDSEKETDVDKKEETYKIDKVNSNVLNSRLTKGITAQSLMPTFNLNAQGSTLKAYNLKISTNKIPYPKSLQEKMNCDLLKPCTFTGTRVQFLLHEIVSKNKINKVAVDRIYINNGIFLAGLYSNCQSQFLEIDARDFYVKQCSVLRDYQE